MYAILTDMLAVFDIGNTNVVVGCFDGEELVSQFRVKTDPAKTLDEYRVLLRSLFEIRTPDMTAFRAAIVCSVVPQLTQTVVQLIQDELRIDALIVGPGIKTGISVKTLEPSAVGADRIVNAVAAKALFGTPALVIDFGTATSFDYVDKEGSYLGGAIAPGLEISVDALVSHTAKLPRIELAWPKNAVGRETVSAMQSGAVLGYLCMVEGLIDRIEREMGKIDHVIATGGLGRVISQRTDRIASYDPHLTLKGMRVLANLNGLS